MFCTTSRTFLQWIPIVRVIRHSQVTLRPPRQEKVQLVPRRAASPWAFTALHCSALRAATGAPQMRKHAHLVDLYLAQDLLLEETSEVLTQQLGGCIRGP